MSIRNLSSGVYGNEVIESKTMQKNQIHISVKIVNNQIDILLLTVDFR